MDDSFHKQEPSAEYTDKFSTFLFVTYNDYFSFRLFFFQCIQVNKLAKSLE